MFDIGFFELMIIAVVGLVVIGPERLPGALRSAALWWGRIKRTLSETRTELEKQLGADEIRRELHNEEVMRSLEALREARDELQRQVKEADRDAHALEHSEQSPSVTNNSKVTATAESTSTANPQPESLDQYQPAGTDDAEPKEQTGRKND